ncbi:piggyBac transposable element-derived protein 2-like [Aphis gossypii]|uniref:piggyBac transposable element-derived protein 2-like n=1 Tax=Aphis gossypii TaxID=80765 RepID=UPI002158D048|nr:piggyBac transposable element-derived protein 2-like [Aphis gossypii]
MPLKRYQQILRCLHFTNNEESDVTDRFFKDRPVLDIIRSNCLKLSQGQRFSIDEMMVPYKGKKAGSRRQYIQNKPKKWGIKLFVRAGIDGMVYDFLVYSGDCTFRNITFSTFETGNFGLGPKVVIALCSTIPNKPLSMVYFDNFFTIPELIYYLRDEFGILSLGTLRKQHLRGCPLIEDKKLNKLPRGSFKSQCDINKIFIIFLIHGFILFSSSVSDDDELVDDNGFAGLFLLPLKKSSSSSFETTTLLGPGA